jgi:hypothetical protein
LILENRLNSNKIPNDSFDESQRVFNSLGEEVVGVFLVNYQRALDVLDASSKYRRNVRKYDEY